MRKTTIGITFVLGLTGTASADHWQTTDDGTYYTDSDYDDDDDCVHDQDQDTDWFTPTVSIPVVRTVVVQPRRGFVWVEGRWAWTGYEWSWVDGYWARARPNRVFVQGRWEGNQGQWRWVAARWRPQPRVIIQTHDRRDDRWNRDDRWRDRVEIREHRRDRDRDRGRGRRWNRGR